MAMVTPPASSSMASGDVGPLRQGATEGLDWFFMATEACGDGTFDPSSVLGFLGFIGRVGVGFTSGGPTGQSQGRVARPRGVGAPLTLVVAPGLLFHIFFFHYFLYFLEKFSVNFQLVPRTFISAQKQHHGSSAENSVSTG